jgi:hypothetical protein
VARTCLARLPTRLLGSTAAVEAVDPRSGGQLMPTVVATHDVQDVDHWLSSPRREEFFGPLGVANIRTFVNPQDRTHVCISFDVPDLGALMAAMDSPEAAAAMEYDGVLGETLVLYVQE